MIPLTLAEVAAVTGGTCTARARGRRRIVVDGRSSSTPARRGPGGLFVARGGERVDGHDFAPARRAAGAVAVLAARPSGGPAVVVDDVQAGARRARPGRRRPAARTSPSSASPARRARRAPRTCSARLLARLGPTVAPAGSFNNEIGLPLTVLRGDRPAPGTSSSRWAPAASATSPTCARSPRPGSASCSTSASRTSASSAAARPSPQAKGELVEALPADGVAVLNADDPLVRAMAARTAARVVPVRPRRPTPTCAPRTSRSTARPAPRFTLAGRRRLGAGRARPARRAPRRQRARRRGRRARARACRSPTSRPALSRRAAGEPLADGGHRARRRRARRQRRLQRQPRLGARRPARPWSRWARRPAATWAVLGEMLELGDQSAAEHDAVGAARRAARRRPARRRRPGGARAILTGAAQGGPWARATRSQRARTPTAAPAAAARRAAAGGRRAGQVPAGDRPGCGSRSVTGRRGRRRGGAGVRAVLIAAAVSLVVSLLRHPAVHPVPRQARLRPVHPRRRPDVAPHQARHAHDGRRRDHRLRRSSPTRMAHLHHHAEPADGVGAARAVPHDRAGRRRLPRRLHQDHQAAQPRPAGRRRSSPASRSSASPSRCWRCSSRTSTTSPPPRRRSRSSGTPGSTSPSPGRRRPRPVRRLGRTS